jgi:hypothetical protein
MFNAKLFFRETAGTVSFAFREYFRPLVAVVRFLKSPLTSSEFAEGQLLPRERLVKGRHHEKLP